MAAPLESMAASSTRSPVCHHQPVSSFGVAIGDTGVGMLTDFAPCARQVWAQESEVEIQTVKQARLGARFVDVQFINEL